LWASIGKTWGAQDAGAPSIGLRIFQVAHFSFSKQLFQPPAENPNMKNQPFMRLTILALLMTSGLACDLRKRNWDYCAANAPCKTGYMCAPELRCVREPDGGIDGARAIDSQVAADAVGLPVDGTAPVLADGPANLVPGQDAGQLDQGSPQVDVAPRLDSKLEIITAPDAAPPTPDGGVPGSGGGLTGGTSGGVTGSGGIATTAGVVASGGSVTTGGVPGSGGRGGSTGGASGSSGVINSGGSATTGGTVASGGAVVATGGTVATGGVVGTGSGTGGTVATGGVVGTGGSTGGTTCQPKSRDCTSSLDNNCNGTPDNQETTYCACPVSQSRACQEHPGYDGVGPCKAGSQTCAASSDKNASSWGACTGATGPSTEVCDAAGLDENCDGQSNEGCDCVNGTSILCDCGPATTCTNGKKGTCSVSKVTLHRDADSDGYGDPARPAMVCPGTSGYVSNADDCDDTLGSGATFKPGVSICSSVTQRKWCTTGASGISQTEPCDQGCINGKCRNDGTIGLPGYVTCGSTRCSTSDGCDVGGICGIAPDFPGRVLCDGPNDCNSGQSCCARNIVGGAQTQCIAGTCAGPNYSEYQVCDPLANTCTCTGTDFNGQLFYVCS
jgi:hypothetical protein